MKRLIIAVIILLFAACAVQNPPPDSEHKVELSDDSIDDYEFGHYSAVTWPSGKNHPLNEVIRNYSYKYNHKYNYHICLQLNQFAYKMMCENEKWRKKYFENNKDQTFEEWQSKYTRDSLDYIVSVCLVEDSLGNEFMIFDENNDEDFSNDPAVKFQIKDVPSVMKDTSLTILYADSDAEYEYYDGKEIKKGNYKIRMVKRTKEKGTFFRVSPDGKFGRVKLGGEKYLIGINKIPDVEYSEYDNIWIDLNHNEKFGYDDYYKQMYLPFTLNNRPYRIKEIDRFGKFVTIEECSPDIVPPIAPGLPAPDFCEILLDSTEFKLSDFKGKLVVLNFWSCDFNEGLSMINRVYDEFKENEKVGIVSFGNYYVENLSPGTKNIKINWPHVDGLLEIKTRTLYQVEALNTTVIISPDGIIKAKKEDISAEDIIKIVKEYMD